MPILVRPVREQLEHDRVIRVLEAKYRRKFFVDINPGDERVAPVKAGPVTLFPDLVLSDDTGRKPYAVVEVETGESVNHLEAMSQWANLAKSKAHLYLYVPVGSVESAQRLCADHQITVAELTSYLSIGDQVRFTTVSKAQVPEPVDKKKPGPERLAFEKSLAEKAAAQKGPVEGHAADADRKTGVKAKPGDRPVARPTVMTPAGSIDRLAAAKAAAARVAEKAAIGRPLPPKLAAITRAAIEAKAAAARAAAAAAAGGEAAAAAEPKAAASPAAPKAGAPAKTTAAPKTAAAKPPAASKAPAPKSAAKPASPKAPAEAAEPVAAPAKAPAAAAAPKAPAAKGGAPKAAAPKTGPTKTVKAEVAAKAEKVVEKRKADKKAAAPATRATATRAAKPAARPAPTRRPAETGRRPTQPAKRTSATRASTAAAKRAPARPAKAARTQKRK